MSEAFVAVTDGWTERTKGSGLRARLGERAGARSLRDALSDAGLGEAASVAAPRRASHVSPAVSDAWSEHTEPLDVRTHPVSRTRKRPLEPRAPLAQSAAVASVAEPEPEPVVVRAVAHHDGVVSPPPWVRAARRGRWEARLHNTFGWMMALVVAASIIGVAGQFLAVPPLHSMQQARQ